MKLNIENRGDLLNNFQEDNKAKKSALKKIIRALDDEIKNLKSTKNE